MKCHSCGNELHIEDAKCPYCGKENPYYKEHRTEMNQYREDFAEVKKDVYEKTGFFAKWTVKITIIAVLVALESALILAYTHAWDIQTSLEQSNARRHLQEHVAVMDKLEAEHRYMEFAVYMDIYDLYWLRECKDYLCAGYVCQAYMTACRSFTQMNQEISYMTMQEKVDTLARNLDYLYGYAEPDIWSKDTPAYEGIHKEVMDGVFKNVEGMLITYTHLTPEEAESFGSLSSGQRIMLLERSMGLHE